MQCALGGSPEENLERITSGVNDAASRGARIVLTPELFEGPYFPRTQDETFFRWARPVDDHPTLSVFRDLARRLSVVLPFSFFEHAGQAYFNSLAMIDADGDVLGIYRKAHIPDGGGYTEKYYFRPGDTAFRVFRTRYGAIGAGVCWDQWYPECARVLALQGAEILLYPTAIGSEPNGEDTREPWRRVMQGHAVANSIPVAAANRIGTEGSQAFYGASFICDARGDLCVDLADAQAVGVHVFDRAELATRRAAWGFFRDRRPELYGALTRADGRGPDA